MDVGHRQTCDVDGVTGWLDGTIIEWVCRWETKIYVYADIAVCMHGVRIHSYITQQGFFGHTFMANMYLFVCYTDAVI